METERTGYRKTTISWCLYDWADSAFATVVIAAVLPVYYSSVAAAHLSAAEATIYWSYTVAISLLLTAFVAPVIGAVSDSTNKKKLGLKVCAGIGIFFTALLYFTGPGAWIYASVVYVIAHAGYSLSEIFYNSLLKFVSKPYDVDRVSTLGYAMGYLGGGLLLGICVLFFMFMEDQSFAARISFLLVAIWWTVFTVPIILNVDEPIANPRNAMSRGNYIREGFGRVTNTFREIRRYRELFVFLIAFWLYNDGIGTIIRLAVIYGAEIGIGSMALIGALLVTQFVGIPFSILFGKLANRIGSKRSIYLGLVVYTIISVSAFFMQTAVHFWILAILVGTVQGGTQALSRSFFSNLVPAHKASEFFGFYGMSSKFAGVAGPLIFALVSQITGDSRLGIISLVVFFVSGITVLAMVDEKKGKEAADSG